MMKITDFHNNALYMGTNSGYLKVLFSSVQTIM